MTQNHAGRWPAQALAAKLVQQIALQVGWSVDIVGMMLDRRHVHYLYAERNHLLLVPTLRSLEAEIPGVNRAMQDSRSDALIFSVDVEKRTVALATGLWGAAGNVWHAPMALWVRNDDCWIVQDPYHPVIRNECFPLISRMRLISASAPWRSKAEHRAGCNHASSWIARMLS